MQVVSQELVQKAIQNTLENESCSDFHEGISCNQKALSQLLIGMKSVSKMYFMVHFVPFLLFKRKKFRQNPRKQLMKLITGFIKSLLFAGGYTALVRRTVCFVSSNYKFVGSSNLIAAIVSAITLNFQPISRQSQIALFCLNKSMEVCYIMATRRNYPVRIPYGECLLVAVSLSLICHSYFDCPESIRDNYKKVLNKLLENV